MIVAIFCVVFGAVAFGILYSPAANEQRRSAPAKRAKAPKKSEPRVVATKAPKGAKSGWFGGKRKTAPVATAPVESYDGDEFVPIVASSPVAVNEPMSPVAAKEPMTPVEATAEPAVHAVADAAPVHHAATPYETATVAISAAWAVTVAPYAAMQIDSHLDEQSSVGTTAELHQEHVATTTTPFVRRRADDTVALEHANHVPSSETERPALAADPISAPTPVLPFRSFNNEMVTTIIPDHSAAPLIVEHSAESAASEAPIVAVDEQHAPADNGSVPAWLLATAATSEAAPAIPAAVADAPKPGIVDELREVVAEAHALSFDGYEAERDRASAASNEHLPTHLTVLEGGGGSAGAAAASSPSTAEMEAITASMRPVIVPKASIVSWPIMIDGYEVAYTVDERIAKIREIAGAAGSSAILRKALEQETEPRLRTVILQIIQTNGPAYSRLLSSVLRSVDAPDASERASAFAALNVIGTIDDLQRFLLDDEAAVANAALRVLYGAIGADSLREVIAEKLPEGERKTSMLEQLAAA